jgi:hypothetical protein
MTNLNTSIAALSTAQLVARFNAITGSKVKKFQDRATAEKRTAAAAADTSAVLRAHLCPHCLGHESSQTAAALEGQPLAESHNLCHECGAVYDNSTGKLHKPAASSASRSEGIRRSWADEATAAARATHTAVTVPGKGQYRSVPAAFRALGLPMGRMIAIRLEVKRNGHAKIGDVTIKAQ